MLSSNSLAAVRRMPVASLMVLGLAAGFVAFIALGVASVGADSLQFAGAGAKSPARFLWFLRDRVNARIGSYTGLSAGWFWVSWDLLGQEPTKKVGIGKNGWMFLRSDGEEEDVRGLRPWVSDEMAEWLNRFAVWCDIARSREVPLVIAIAPNKSSLLPLQLRVDEVAPFDQTRYGGLRQARDEWSSDLRRAMLDLHAVIEDCDPERSYFRTDSHWNYHGAACAADAIAERLESLGVAPQVGPGLSMREELADGGDLARMLGVASRFSESISVPDRFRDIRSIEDLQQWPPPPLPSGVSSNPRVLVVHDSFGMILRDPLSAILPGCVYERGLPSAMTGAELSNLIDRESPDAIVVLFVERRLTEGP